MGREVTKTPDTKLRDNTPHHVGQEHTLLYYSTQIAMHTLIYAAQGPAQTSSVIYLTIRLWARDFYEVIVDEAEGRINYRLIEIESE